MLPLLSSGRGPRHTASARREGAQVVVDGRGDERQVACRARATGLWRLHDAGGDAHNQWPSAPAERMLTRKTWLQRLAWMYTASILLRKRHTQCSLHARGQPLPIPRPPNSLVLRGRASPPNRYLKSQAASSCASEFTIIMCRSILIATPTLTSGLEMKAERATVDRMRGRGAKGAEGERLPMAQGS